MEHDFRKKQDACCPPVDCHKKADDCCWVTKVLIPAVLGDDSETSKVKPFDGAYQNKIVEYEANGAIYFYSSDGIYTKLGNSLDIHNAASIAFVEEQDRATLAKAKDYADEAAAGAVTTAEGYADTKDAATLQSAKDYADGKDATTLSSAKGYADGVAAQALSDAKAYTDSAASSVVTRTYVDNQDAATLAAANQNTTDVAGTLRTDLGGDITALENSLATVATTGLYSDLSGTPDVPVISMTTTDPGEGAPLAANHFIGVYS